MKNKLLADITVYMVSPVLVFSFVDIMRLKYFVSALIVITILYTIINKKKNGQINLTGLFFAIMYIAYFSYRQNTQLGFERYMLDTYFLMICIISVGILNLFNKSIVKQVCIDILKTKGWSSLNIWNIFRKSDLSYQLKKIESMIIVHVLVIALIRIYSILTYGVEQYATTTDLQILANVLFIIGEVYLLSKVISNSKTHNKTVNNNINNNINNKETDESSKRVINLNQYKDMNK